MLALLSFVKNCSFEKVKKSKQRLHYDRMVIITIIIIIIIIIIIMKNNFIELIQIPIYKLHQYSTNSSDNKEWRITT